MPQGQTIFWMQKLNRKAQPSCWLRERGSDNKHTCNVELSHDGSSGQGSGVRDVLLDEVSAKSSQRKTFEQILKGSKREPSSVWWKRVPNRDNAKCKACQIFVLWGKSREMHEAGPQ